MARFSMNEVLKNKFGSNEKKSVKKNRSEKRAKKKGKYKTFYDKDGVKHMILQDYDQ